MQKKENPLKSKVECKWRVDSTSSIHVSSGTRVQYSYLLNSMSSLRLWSDWISRSKVLKSNKVFVPRKKEKGIVDPAQWLYQRQSCESLFSRDIDSFTDVSYASAITECEKVQRIEGTRLSCTSYEEHRGIRYSRDDRGGRNCADDLPRTAEHLFWCRRIRRGIEHPSRAILKQRNRFGKGKGRVKSKVHEESQQKPRQIVKSWLHSKQNSPWSRIIPKTTFRVQWKWQRSSLG